MPMERINLYLSKRQKKALQSLSKKTGLAVAEHIRRAVDRYLEEQERKGQR